MIESSHPWILSMLVLLGAMFALLIPALWVSYRLRSRLQMKHPSVWADLGKPGFANLTIASSSRAARFLRSGDYRALADPVLNKCAFALRILSLTYLGCFLTFFALFIVQVFGN
jgi:hypothetical protein